MTEPDAVAVLLAERRVVRVTPNRAFVGARLKQAADNVDSARLLCASNPRASITIAYDAIRFAVDAHMEAHGLRITNEPAAHRVAVVYARTRMHNLVEAKDLDDYEALRAIRNRIEYPEPGTRNALTTSDAQEIATCAQRTVVAVTRWWVASTPTPEPSPEA